jgi:hypothetical protein
LRLERLEGRAVPAFGFGWALGLGGTGMDIGHGVATDADGNVYALGTFAGTVNFDPSGANPAGVLTSVGSHDNYAARYSPTGAFLWATDLGFGSGPEITVRGSDAYVVGIGADPGGQPNTLASRLDAATGGVLWTERIATTSSDANSHAVAIGPSGNAYVLGTTASSQAFVVKLDPTGAVLWTQTTAGGSAEGFGMTADGADDVYLTGGYAGAVGFGGRTLTSLSGTQDAFVWKPTRTAAPPGPGAWATAPAPTPVTASP